MFYLLPLVLQAANLVGGVVGFVDFCALSTLSCSRRLLGVGPRRLLGVGPRRLLGVGSR